MGGWARSCGTKLRPALFDAQVAQIWGWPEAPYTFRGEVNIRGHIFRSG